METDKIHKGLCQEKSLSFCPPIKERIRGLHARKQIRNGPLLVYGNITVKDRNGNSIHKNKVNAFCRCGQSSNKPYCYGTHVKSEFRDA